MSKESTFKGIDLGTPKPTSIPMETIEVVISSNNLLGEFGNAFVNEGYRKNPLLMKQIQLTQEEMQAYCTYLLDRRIACINNSCPEFSRLKVLNIPSWIQYNLSMIGEVLIRDKGLRLIPVMEETDIISYQQALVISNKIRMLTDDLQIVEDGMPRSKSGDKDVMSTALIAGYVRSLEKVEHVASTYVTAFLGMKLKEESAMATLYRVQYDDYEFIASALLAHGGLY